MKKKSQYLKLKSFEKKEIPNFKNLPVWQTSLKSLNLKFVLILLLSLSVFSACDPPKGKTKTEVIEERIAHRMGNWLHTYNKKCREDVLEAAALIVDSTLIVNARRHKDTLNRPPRPMKPDNPNFVAPKDSIPIAPLVDLDSLLRLDSLEILEDSIKN